MVVVVVVAVNISLPTRYPRQDIRDTANLAFAFATLRALDECLRIFGHVTPQTLHLDPKFWSHLQISCVLRG